MSAIITLFRTILVANRGEIACRIIRTARRLGYRTVAVHMRDESADMHVRMADASVVLDGETLADTFLSIDAILRAAHVAGADAIHPGYGFLSENPDFADGCASAGIVFIGPSADSIRLMGDKGAAKRAMAAAGVPCIPGHESEDQSEAGLADSAAAIGYPVMIKAAMGGGGRGMRLAENPAAFVELLRIAKVEARAAFGDDHIILEKAISDARHVEIQVFGDRHGNAIHLGERDCSVQRRHQKLIEEAPSPAVSPQLRDAMGRVSCEAVRAIGYEGAGTLEFLLGPAGNFHFMEMNTRLQVEHPVTEAITGLDLVELQLRIAAGEPMGITQADVRFEGHAIEARLCAEDPANGFLPQTGKVALWRMPQGLRTDTAMETGASVSQHHDSMIAKLVSHGPDRETARRKLIAGLEEADVLGIRTNREFLVAALSHGSFVAGEATTRFVEANLDALTAPDRDSTVAFAAAAVLRLPLPGMPASPVMPYAAPLRFLLDETPVEASATFTGRELVEVTIDSVTSTVGIVAIEGHDIRLRIDGVESVAACVLHLGEGGFSWKGRSHVLRDRTFEPAVSAGKGRGGGMLHAKMAGRVVAVHAVPGDPVAAGQSLVIVEAMKLQHAHALTVGGRVAQVLVREGDQVATGQALLRLETEKGPTE